MSFKKLVMPYNQDTITTSINAHNIIFQLAETLSSKSNMYSPPLKHIESPPTNMKRQTRMVTRFTHGLNIYNLHLVLLGWALGGNYS